MQLVNEQHNLAVRLFNLFEHSFQTVFKLTTKFRARQHRAQIQRDHALVAQALRHVTGNNAPRQPLDDRRLAHARLANQHRVILRPTAQHLDHAPNLLVAPDHRIQLAAPRQLRQILGVFFKRLKLALGILVGDALGAPHRRQRLQNRLMGRADGRQRSAGRITLQVGRAQQQVFRGNVLVLEVRRLAESLLQRPVQRVAQPRLACRSRNPRQFLLDLVQIAFQPSGRHTNLLQHRGNHALAIFHQRQ